MRSAAIVEIAAAVIDIDLAAGIGVGGRKEHTQMRYKQSLCVYIEYAMHL